MPFMTRLHRPAVVCVAVSLAIWAGGCAKEGDPPESLPPQPGPPAATLTLSTSPDGPQQTMFESSVDDIVLTTFWQNVSGPRLQVTRWRQPNSHLYEQRTQEFSGGSPVVTSMAVSGAPVSVRSLSGTWRVEVFLDNAAIPAAVLAFTVRE